MTRNIPSAPYVDDTPPWSPGAIEPGRPQEERDQRLLEQEEARRQRREDDQEDAT